MLAILWSLGLVALLDRLVVLFGLEQMLMHGRLHLSQQLQSLLPGLHHWLLGLQLVLLCRQQQSLLVWLLLRWLTQLLVLLHSRPLWLELLPESLLRRQLLQLDYQLLLTIGLGWQHRSLM